MRTMAFLIAGGALGLAALSVAALPHRPSNASAPERLSLVSRLVARQAADRKTLQIHTLWRATGEEWGSVLGDVSGMAEGADGRIWLTDGMTRTVLQLTADRSVATRVAGPGNGPGEVRAPSMMSPLPDGGVAVYDVGRAAVEIFDRTGRPVRRVGLEALVINPKGFTALPSGGFVLSGGLPSSTDAIHVFSPRGELQRSFHPRPVTRDPRAGQLVAGGPVEVLPDGRILFSQAAPHRMFLYDPATGRGRALAEDTDLLAAVGDDFIRVEEGQRTFRWYFAQSRGAFPLPGGRYLNVVSDRERDSSTWDVYAADGTRLARRTFGRAYQPWAMTRDGDVLASYTDPETDEPVVARLAVALR